MVCLTTRARNQQEIRRKCKAGGVTPHMKPEQRKCINRVPFTSMGILIQGSFFSTRVRAFERACRTLLLACGGPRAKKLGCDHPEISDYAEEMAVSWLCHLFYSVAYFCVIRLVLSFSFDGCLGRSAQFRFQPWWVSEGHHLESCRGGAVFGSQRRGWRGWGFPVHARLTFFRVYMYIMCVYVYAFMCFFFFSLSLSIHIFIHLYIYIYVHIRIHIYIYPRLA